MSKEFAQKFSPYVVISRILENNNFEDNHNYSDLTREELNNIINEERHISDVLAFQLALYSGLSFNYWKSLYNNYLYSLDQ